MLCREAILLQTESFDHPLPSTEAPMSYEQVISFFSFFGCAIPSLSCCLVTTQASSICKRGEVGGGEENMKGEPEVTLLNCRLPYLSRT